MRTRFNIAAEIIGRYGENSEKAHWLLRYVGEDNLKRQLSIMLNDSGKVESCGFHVENTKKGQYEAPMKFVSGQAEAWKIFNVIAANLSISQGVQIGSAISQVRDSFDNYYFQAEEENRAVQEMIDLLVRHPIR